MILTSVLLENRSFCMSVAWGGGAWRWKSSVDGHGRSTSITVIMISSGINFVIIEDLIVVFCISRNRVIHM